MTWICPHCKTENQEVLQQCECGYGPKGGAYGEATASAIQNEAENLTARSSDDQLRVPVGKTSFYLPMGLLAAAGNIWVIRGLAVEAMIRSAGQVGYAAHFRMLNITSVVSGALYFFTAVLALAGLVSLVGRMKNRKREGESESHSRSIGV